MNLQKIGHIGDGQFKPANTELQDGVLWKMCDGYKWGQTVYDIQIVSQFPEGTRGRNVDVKFTANTLTFGLKGSPPILDGELDFTIKPKESTWSIDPDSGELIILLQKAIKHENWKSVIKGVGVVDPFTAEEMGKKMMIEKFQLEVFFSQFAKLFLGCFTNFLIFNRTRVLIFLMPQ